MTNTITMAMNRTINEMLMLLELFMDLGSPYVMTNNNGDYQLKTKDGVFYAYINTHGSSFGYVHGRVCDFNEFTSFMCDVISTKNELLGGK